MKQRPVRTASVDGRYFDIYARRVEEGGWEAFTELDGSTLIVWGLTKQAAAEELVKKLEAELGYSRD